MPATVTLSSTTLEVETSPSERQVKVASTSGLTPGIGLFVDAELMTVVSLGVDSWVNVLRGVGGTSAAHHESKATAYIGRADQFYGEDPVGSPPAVVNVSPYINTVNGTVWFAQGDPTPSAHRWWQKQTTSYGAGPLGVRTVVQDPTSST